MAIGFYGSDEYGSSPYGGSYPPFGLDSATALTPTIVRVRYTALVDPAFPPLLSIANYSIFPGLVIHSVILESAQTVLLITDPQVEILYTLTINEARGAFGQPLDPDLDEVTFTGAPVAPYFYAVATRERRVRAVFSEAMLQNAALTDPMQYALTDLSGSAIPILTVATEQATDTRSVVLTLGADLVDERHYKLMVSNLIVTVTLKLITPDTDVFQWVANVLRTSIAIDRFSGEVQNGLYGIHGGLVFFSPALTTAVPDSVIQVEEVDVCTKAFDEYHFPEPIDPPVLYTHGAGVVPTPVVTVLNSAASLWAKFPRLSDVQFNLGNQYADTVPAPVDGPATATLLQPWDPAYVSLLNNPHWKLFDNAGTPPAYFITANNLGPIPPGPPITIILQP